MRRVLLIFVAIAAVVAVEIVWLAPATLVGSRIGQATAGALHLAESEGTIWHARGLLVGGGARLPIAWDLEFWPLIRGDVRLRIAPYAGTATGPPRANLRLRANTVSVSDAEVVFPAPMLAAIAEVPPSWIVGGDVGIAANAFEWAPPANRGEARIVWQRALVTPPAGGDALDLGTVTLELSVHGDGARGPVRNEGGDLSVQGELVFRTSEGAVIMLTLAPRDSADPAVARSLAALGATETASWHVEWRIPVQ